MKRFAKINRVAIGAAAGLTLLAGLSGTALGQINIGIKIGLPTPPPPPRETVVVEFDSYHTGYRANLYDADWRLRVAQTEQWHAADELETARHREGEVAVVVDEQEALVAKFARQAALSEEAVAEARARFAAFSKRLESARSDLDSARVLHDAAGAADAEARISTNQAGVDKAAGEIQLAEEVAAAKEKLAVAQAELPKNRAALDAAHENVFASRAKLDAATQSVALALHDRDEAMWLLYRDEIMTGRCEFGRCGFHMDLGVWGGRMPRDPEVAHAYFVHPVGYWVERPTEIQTRVIEVDSVGEIARVREVQRKHEPRVAEIEIVERSVPVERRRVITERVVVERERLVAEKSERATAAAEHRPVRVLAEDRAAAKAEVIEARGNAKAEKIEAHADAKAKLTEAHADAKAEKIDAHADAKAKLTEAHADAKAEKIDAHADAKSKVTEAHADAKAEKIDAHADAKAKLTEAHADAKSEKIGANADAKSKVVDAKADAKSDKLTGSSSSRSSRSTSTPDSSSSRNAFGVGSSNSSSSGSRDSRSSSSSNSSSSDSKKKKNNKDDNSEASGR